MKTSTHLFIALLLSIFLRVNCAAQAGAAPTTSTTQAGTNAPADYSKQAYVQEELKNSIRFESDGTGRRRISGRYRVESEAGVQQLGLIRMGYNTAFERVTIDYLRVIKPDGRVIEVGSDSIQDLPSEIQRLAPQYTDFREKHINVPALRPGDRLEYSFTTDVHTPMIAGQFWAEYSFEHTVITLDEQVELDIPADRAVKVKFASGLTPKIEEVQGRKVYRWTHSNLKAPEPGPADDDEARPPDMQLTSFRDWAEVGRWYAALQRPKAEVTPAIRAEAEELTKGLTSEADRIAAIYGFVSSNVRYLGLSFGLGRFEPHAAGDVLQNMYGDCKDKQTLLTALLAAIGIKSDAVLISPERKLDADIPSPAQFSHVIGVIAAGNRETYVDTTSEVGALGYLIPPLRKKQGLRVGGDVGSLVTTTAQPPVANLEDLSVDGRVDESGKLDATVTLHANGDPEVVWRTILRRTSEAQWPQIFKVTFEALGLAGEVSNVTSSDPSDARKPLELKLHLSNAKFVDWSTAAKLSLPMIKIGARPAATPEQKKGAIHQGSPTLTVRELRLELPPAKTVLPPLKSGWSEDFAEYKATYKMEGTVLSARREYRTKLEEVPRARYKEFTKLYDDIAADEGEEAQIARPSGGSALVPGSDVSTKDAPRQARELFASASNAWGAGNIDKAERELREVVKLDPKYPQAWLGLARVYTRKSFLGKTWLDQAMGAYRNELAADPQDATALREFSYLLFKEGRMAEAAEVMKKCLEVAPDTPGMYTMLGLAYLYAGRPAEAIAPLEHASSESLTDRHALARAYFETGAPDKAMQALAQDLEGLNTLQQADAALVLADAGVNLAQAEEAVSAALETAYETLKLADFAEAEKDQRTWKLASLWDAAGWVYWKKGDAASAHKYLEAAWSWSRQMREGDHLARVYQSEGKTAEAINIWAEALSQTIWQEPEIHARFVKAAGSAERAEELMQKHRLDGQNERSYEFANKRKLNGSAQVKLLIGPGPTVADAQFASGDEKLKAYAPEIKALRLRVRMPDADDIRVAREAIVSCTDLSPKCMVVLTPAPAVVRFDEPRF